MLAKTLAQEIGLSVDETSKLMRKRWKEQGLGISEIAIVRVFVTRGFRYALLLNDAGFRFKMEVIGRFDVAIKEPNKKFINKFKVKKNHSIPDYAIRIDPNKKGWYDMDNDSVWLSLTYCSNYIYKDKYNKVKNAILSWSKDKMDSRLRYCMYSNVTRIFIRIPLTCINSEEIKRFDKEYSLQRYKYWKKHNALRLEKLVRLDIYSL